MSTWILLRGLTREARHWGDFAAHFEHVVAADDPGARVVTLELPGNGEANGMRSPARVADYVDAVRKAAAAHASGGPYCVLAMSLGGMVATAWAQRHPMDIERLVLINTSMRPFCGPTQRLRVSAWPTLAWAVANWRRAQRCESAIHALTCEVRAHRERDIERWSEIRRTRPVDALNGLRQLAAAARFEAGRQAPRCPTLILSSACDRLVDPVCSSRIALQWRAEYVEHPHAGHDLPHDDPVWVSDAVRNWLGSHQREPRVATASAA
jgi:pimeloyl-ACP methyl ester carboxylesterase